MDDRYEAPKVLWEVVLEKRYVLIFMPIALQSITGEYKSDTWTWN